MRIQRRAGLTAAAVASLAVAMLAPSAGNAATTGSALQSVNVDTGNTSAPAPVELDYRGLRADEEPADGLANPYRGYRAMNEYQAKDLRDPFASQERTRSWDGKGYDASDFTDWTEPSDIRQALPVLSSVYKTRDWHVTQLYFYLSDYVCKTGDTSCDPTLYANGLPQAALDNIKSTLQGLREAGWSAVLRFAYATEDGTAATNWDYTVATIEQHIAQLAPIVAQYSDVVANWQVGFIGAWGEWSIWNPTGCPQSSTCTNELMTYMVQHLPYGVDTAMRYLGNRSSVTDPAIRARIGMHDDAFLSGSECPSCDYNPNDAQVVNEARDQFVDCEPFWNQPQLGNPDNGAYMDPMLALRRASTLRCTTFNRVHNPRSYNHWKATYVEPVAGGGVQLTSTDIPAYSGNTKAMVAAEPDYFENLDGTPVKRTVYDFMRDHLGYRLQLDKALIGVGHGTSLPVTLDLRNFGFASPRKPGQVRLDLLDSTGKVVRSAWPGTDWRKWYPAQAAEYAGADGVPPTDEVNGTLDLSGLPAGSYTLGLHLPSPGTSPAYEVRLANGGKLGWNGTDNLLATVKVK